MKKRWVTVVLLLLVLLAVGANVYVYLTAHAQPRFKIDSDDVVRIEVRSYDFQNWTFGQGMPKFRADRGGRFITAPEEIELFCDVLSTLFVREYPLETVNENMREHIIRVTYDICFIFHLKDGSTRTFIGQGSHARIDGHWCYISCGNAHVR